MINLQLTEAGQNAIGNDNFTYFATFIASDSFDYEDMEAWRRGTYQGNAQFQLFPVAYVNIIPKGRLYTDGYNSEVLDHTIVEIVGAVETYKLSESFEINSIGIVATDSEDSAISSWSSFIFAFGSLELNTYPLPVNEDDTITYIIPFKANYGDNVHPRVSAPDNLTPWKTFLEHNNSLIINPLQTHGLWIDLLNMNFRVGGVTIRIPTSEGGESDLDARIDAIYEQLEGAVKYKPEQEITQNTTFAAVNASSNLIVDSTAKVVEYEDSRISKASLYDMVNSIAGSDTMKINIWVASETIRGGSWSTWDYNSLIYYCPGYPLYVLAVPKNKYWYDYGITYELLDVRSNNNPGSFTIQFSHDPAITPSNNVSFTLFVVYDSWINHFPPPFDPPFTPPS